MVNGSWLIHVLFEVVYCWLIAVSTTHDQVLVQHGELLDIRMRALEERRPSVHLEAALPEQTRCNTQNMANVSE